VPPKRTNGPANEACFEVAGKVCLNLGSAQKASRSSNLCKIIVFWFAKVFEMVDSSGREPSRTTAQLSSASLYRGSRVAGRVPAQGAFNVKCAFNVKLPCNQLTMPLFNGLGRSLL
jgi:hypothetical protein